MNRLFGTTKPATKPSLQGALSKVDSEISRHDVKISAFDAELSSYSTKLSKMRDGPGKRALKSKAMQVLQRRKQAEQQRNNLYSQVKNMEDTQMMQDNLQNTMITVDALKTTTKELKKQYGKVDINKIEKLQDEMADLMDVGRDIQETMARSYDVPDEVDESELDAELEALGMEAEWEGEMGMESTGAVPSFMQEEMPDFLDETPAMENQKEVAR